MLFQLFKRLGCRQHGERGIIDWNRIEINSKKNKPVEKLIEVREICRGCGAVINKGYFTEEQWRNAKQVSPIDLDVA